MDAIFNVDDAPFSLKLVSVLATVAAAATVVNVGDHKTAAGPIKLLQVKLWNGSRGRSAVGHHDQWG